MAVFIPCTEQAARPLDSSSVGTEPDTCAIMSTIARPCRNQHRDRRFTLSLSLRLVPVRLLLPLLLLSVIQNEYECVSSSLAQCVGNASFGLVFFTLYSRTFSQISNRNNTPSPPRLQFRPEVKSAIRARDVRLPPYPPL